MKTAGPIITVPPIVVPGLPAVWPMRWRCEACDAPFAAVSQGALSAAFDEHVAYVNTHADRATDPHFELQRLDSLIAD